MRKRPVAFLILILLVAVAAGLFVYPKSIGSRFLPWRLGLDLIGGSHLTYEVDMTNVKAEDRDSVASGLRDVIERRVNLFGVSEPQVLSAQSGDSYRLIVELAGIQNVAAAIKEIGETPFLTFAEVAMPLNPTATSTFALENFKLTDLNGRYVKGAQLTFEQITGQSEVSLEFDDVGAKLFEELTARNVGKQIAVFLDNELITAPVVQEKISGGRAQITGNFSITEAKELVARFNAGALPAPIVLIGQDTIGASLGAEALQKTIFAGIIGTLIVMLFMVAYYRGFGFFACLALLIYIAFVLAVFKLFGITMTLSGIAGIILSIGMAVDANILIFERSREELRAHGNVSGAIEDGFKRAWPSIRDSNISTIITSLILFFFTTGFVRGFALALLVGVLVSMFSAITVTRTMMRVFVKSEARNPKPETNSKS
mgnify:CR=1 FL=1